MIIFVIFLHDKTAFVTMSKGRECIPNISYFHIVLHQCKICMFIEKEEVLQAVNNEYACSGTGDKQDTGCKGDNGGGELDQNMGRGGQNMARGT